MSTEPTQLQTTARIPAFFGGLTTKQSNFIDNYLGVNGPEMRGHGGKAAFAAGYGGDLTIASVRASQLLRVRKIQEEIKRRLGTSVASPSEVLENITSIARADIANVLEPDGSLDLKAAKRRGQSKLIKSLSFDKETGKLTKLEMYSAHEAQRDLGKFHGLFIERSETVNINLNLDRGDLSSFLDSTLSDVIDVTPEPTEG